MPPLAVPRCCGSDLLRFVAAPPGGRRPKLTEAPASGLSGADLAGAASLLRQLAERLAALGLGLRNCAACGGQTAGARGEVVPGVCLRGLPSDVRRRLRLRLPLCGACHRAAISGQLAERRRSAACAAPAAGGAHRETAGSLAPAIGARSMAKVLLAWRQAPPQLQELARRKHAADAARREAAGSSEAEACGETYKALRKELAQAAQRADSGRRGWGRGSHSRSLVGRAVNTPPQELEHYLAAARECLGKSPGAEISHQELVALTRPPPGGRHAPPRPGARSSNNEGVAAAAGGGLCSLVRRWRQVWLSAVRPVGLAEGWDPPPEQTGRVESHPPRTSLAVLGEELAALVAAAPGGELPLEQLLQEYSLRFARSLRPEDYGFSRQKRLLRQAAGPLGLAVVQRANTLWLSSRCTTPSPPAAAGGPPAPKAQDDAEELDALRRWGLAGAVDAGATRLVALPPCELLRALRRAEAAGLTDVVVPGRTLAESAAASAVAGQSTASGAPAVWCTVGAAEWEWQGDPEGTAELLAALAAGEQSRCVALECAAGAGAELLEHLLGLAGRLGLPCVITAGDPREEQAATAALGRHPRVPVIVRSPPGAAPAWAGMGHYVAVAGLAGPVPPERLLLASAGGLAVGGGCPAEAWEPAALPAAARSCAAALGSGAQQTAALSGRNAAAVLRLGGAPLPQGDKECPFFRAHGWCKFGPRCGRGHGGGGLTLPPEVALGRPPCPGWTLRGLEIDFSARKVLRIRRDHRAAVQRLEAVCCAALQARQVPGTRRCGVIDGDAEGCWAALTMLRLAQGDTPGVVGCLWGPPPAAEAPAPVLSRRPCCPHCFKQLPACTGSHYSASPPLDGGAAAAAWDDAAHGGERACLWGGAAAAAILPLLEDAQGHAQRARTRAQLEGLLRRQYPRARLYMFGSAATGLALRGADTDFAAQLEPAPGDAPPAQEAALVERIFKLLRRDRFARLFRITKTRVPIVGNRGRAAQAPAPAAAASSECGSDAVLGVQFDISLRLHGVRNSALLRHYCLASPAMRVAAAAAKWWARGCGIVRPREGYLTPYAVNILFVYSTLWATPHCAALQWLAPDKVPLGVSCPPCPPPPPSCCDSAELRRAAGELLGRFWHFYAAEFRWTQEVATLSRDPRATRPTKLELGWGEADVVLAEEGAPADTPAPPAAREHYHLCIEDPYEESPGGGPLNLGRKLTLARAAEVRSAFQAAWAAYADGRPPADWLLT